MADEAETDGATAEDTGAATDGTQRTALAPEHVGALVGSVEVLVFLVVGTVVFGDPVFGAAVGAAFGTSTFLYLTYAMDLQGDVPLPAYTVEEPIERDPVYHRGAGGLALVPVGIVPFVWRLFADGYTPGILVGMALAVPTYVVFSTLLPDPD